MCVLEKEMDDPGVALLINHSKIVSYEIHLLFIFNTCTEVKTLLSFVQRFQPYLAMWLMCLVSLLIKNVGVILSFDKNKTDLDC